MRSVIVLGLTLLFIAGSSVRDVEAKMSLDQVTNMLKPMSKKCAAQLGISRDVLDQIRDTKVVPQDHNLGCYYACLLKSLKAMSKDGKILTESVLKQIDMMLPDDVAGRVRETFFPCSESASKFEDPCDACWELASCYYIKDPDMCFFP